MCLVSNPFNRRKLRFSDPAVSGVTGDIPVFYRLIRLNLASIVGTVTSWEGDG